MRRSPENAGRRKKKGRPEGRPNSLWRHSAVNTTTCAGSEPWVGCRIPVLATTFVTVGINQTALLSLRGRIVADILRCCAANPNVAGHSSSDPVQFELTPQFSYSHWDTVQDPFVRNSYSGALTVRAGLPWTSQVAVSLRYTYSQLRDGSTASGLG